MLNNSYKEDLNVDEQNKIYIIGEKSVGKTSLFHLIFSEKFNENIPPSEIGIIKSQYKKGRKKFTIKDLTDDENFSSTNILKNELEDVLLIFILFALNDKDSFEYAKNLIKFIKINLIDNKDMNIILLGNKYDIGKEAFEVQREEIDKYIYKIENLYYYEISCKNGHNISKIKEIIDDIEINEEENDDDKLTEEERLKKVNEAKGNSCLIS